jgi:hypothetical protein
MTRVFMLNCASWFETADQGEEYRPLTVHSIKCVGVSMNDQDDRLRLVFSLTRDDLLPEVNGTSLRIYYKSYCDVMCNWTLVCTSEHWRRQERSTSSHSPV